MRRWRRKVSGAICIADFGDGSGGYSCKLVNFSNGGARLSGFGHLTVVPNVIALFIRDRQIVKRDCRVAWRRSRDMGVQSSALP
jgi:hypothetical protein